MRKTTTQQVNLAIDTIYPYGPVTCAAIPLYAALEATGGSVRAGYRMPADHSSTELMTGIPCQRAEHSNSGLFVIGKPRQHRLKISMQMLRGRSRCGIQRLHYRKQIAALGVIEWHRLT